MKEHVIRAKSLSKPMRNWLYFFVVAYIFIPRYFSVNAFFVSIPPMKVIEFLTCALCLFMLVMSKTLRRDTVRGISQAKIPLTLMMGYLVWQLLSDMRGELPGISHYFYIQYIITLASGYLIGLVFFNDARVRAGFVMVFILSVVIVSLIGIFERITGQTLLTALNISSISADEGMAQQMAGSLVRNGGFRAHATFSHAITYGQFLAAAAPLCALFAWQRKDKLLSLIARLAIVLIPFGMYASGSNSTFFVVAAAFTCAFVYTQRGNKIQISLRIFALTAVVGFVAYFGKSIIKGIIVGNASSASSVQILPSRMIMLINGYFKVIQQPFFGYGSGLAPYEGGLIGGSRIVTIDCLYLSIALESGLVGLVLFVLMVISICAYGLRLTQHLVYWRDRYLVIGLSAMVAGIFVGQSVLSIPENVFYLYLVAGMFTALVGCENMFASRQAP